MTTFRQRQRLVREDEILNATHDLIARKGYHAMAMDEVADTVGISKATLYQHFATKEDLAAAVIVRDMNRFIEFMTDPERQTRRPIDRLADALAAVIESHRADVKPDFCGNTEELYRIFHARPDVGACQTRCWELLTRLVDEAKSAHQVSQHIPTAVIVALFFSIAVGHLFSVIVRERLVSRAELAAGLTAVFFQGIAALPIGPGAPVHTGG